MTSLAWLAGTVDGIAEPSKGDPSRCHGRVASMRTTDGATKGSNRDDVIIGGPRRERLDGRKGHDRLCGRGGEDRLRGRTGNDRLSGGPASDRLDAGPGSDLLRGGAGGDRLDGDSGADTIRGNAGRDRVDAADGDPDRVRAGDGRDRIGAKDGASDGVNCGPGIDRARVDDLDVTRGCERVALGGEDFASPAWSDTGFVAETNWGTIGTGDVDGDGTAELVGRSQFGVETYEWDPQAGRWKALYAGAAPALTDAAGWGDPSRALTIQIAPTLSGDGALIAREGDGLHAWGYAAGSGWSELPIQGERPFPDSEGFTAPDKYTTIGTGSFGRGYGFIFGRQSQALEIWALNQTGDQFAELGSIFMRDSDGWSQPSRYSTIQAADIVGNGRDEIVARDSSGMASWTTQGIPITANGPFSDAEGWTDPSRYETIQPADLDGDGKDEIIGRGPDGIEAYSLESGDQVAAGGPFGDASGAAANASYYSTIGAADLDGDGDDEIYGRLPDGLHVYGLEDGNWAEVTPALADLRDANAWNDARYYGTIQTADVGAKKPEVILARDNVGVRSLRYSEEQKSWVDSEPFPQYDSGDEETAYAAINDLAGGDTAGFDLRSAYAQSDSTTLLNYRVDVSNMSQPDGVSDAAWTEVKGEILAELGNASDAAAWFEEYQVPLTTTAFTAEGFDTTAETIRYDADSDIQLEMERWQAMTSTIDYGLAAFEVVPGVAAAGGVIASSVAGAAFANGLGAPDIDGALGEVEGTYVQLRSQLQSDFTAGIDGLAASEDEILGDYGLQTVVGDEIAGDLWKRMSARDQATFLASGERAFEIQSWQTMMPAIWTGYVLDDEFEQDSDACFQRGQSSSNVCDIRDGSGNYLLDVNALRSSDCPFVGQRQGPCTPPPADQRAKLFGATADGCVTSSNPDVLPNWNSAQCDLGVDPHDVYGGTGDWSKLPLYSCTGDPNLSNNPCDRTR